MPDLSAAEFEKLSRFIMDTAGIQLDKGKEYLMEARLEPILERLGFKSYNDLHKHAVSDASGKLKASIIDAITINETYFFRDNTPFELLKNKILPEIIDQKSKVYGQHKIPLKIWSAACSTGQEVYSLAMTLSEMRLFSERFDISILGTDISNEAVAKASYGKYNQFEIERGLSSYFLNKYFSKTGNGWRIKDEIRVLARFSQMDLNKPFTALGTFDVILCRNVAIYFPTSGKIKLFNKLADCLNASGALIVGGSESLAGLTSEFVPKHYLNGVFYQLRQTDMGKPIKPALSPYQKAAVPTPPPPIANESKTIPIPAKPHESSTNLRLAQLKKRKTEQVKDTPPVIVDPTPEKQPTKPPEVLKPNKIIEPAVVNQVIKTPIENGEKSSLLLSLQNKSHKQAQASVIFQEKAEKKEKKTSLLDKLKEKDDKKT